jgi:tetratricopeptide (TPR) repeat protein
VPALLAATIAVAWPSIALAQRDSIDLVSGRPMRGTIQSSTAAALVIESEDGQREVPGWQIRRVRFDGEPNELTRARNNYAEDRYNAALEELERLTAVPDRALVAADIDWLKAMSAARTALTGGGITANQALTAISEFVQKHPDHYALEPAREAWADLTYASGKFADAANMYDELAKGPWPEISFQARVKQGRSLVLAEKYTEAISVLEAAEQVENAEDYAMQGKAVSRCLRAQAMAFAGQPDEAQVIALETIRTSDATNTVLFGWAYNALGASHLQKGELKEAARAYLHTDLLFPADADAHAQALYQLAQIWPQLNHEERALEARQEIQDRYRNTFWATALDK